MSQFTDIPASSANRSEPPILSVRDLQVQFPAKSGSFFGGRKYLRAVDNISFSIARGETLGLVGESGCGKSTTGRAILRLNTPSNGTITFDGKDMGTLGSRGVREIRQHLQMIFQDPYASLDPLMTVGQTVAEPLEVHGLARGKRKQERVEELFDLVGLNASFMNRYPHEFSGGQRQRVGIARALATNPSLIICDEPVSALDVSIQAQVINLLEELQEKLSLTYLFIAHDLGVVRHISDRIAVMYLGKIVEVTTSDLLYEAPIHPYTKALLSAVPIPDPRREKARKRITLKGDLPSPLSPPSGCRFRTRCAYARALCSTSEPELTEVSPGRHVACHFWSEIQGAEA